MKNTMLLPRICRIIGLVLLPLFLGRFIAHFNYDFSFSFLDMPVNKKMDNLSIGNHNLTDEVAVSGVIIALLMIAFSKLKHEDEYVTYIRLRSLQFGVYANYLIFIVLTFSVYGLNYLSVLSYNVATILILFILIFNFQLYISPRLTKSIAA